MGDQGFTVKAPSMINNHLQAESPLAPFRPPVIPAAMRPENAPERRDLRMHRRGETRSIELRCV
jgi:hypothetical protein